jgi:hypothetical protein
VNKPQYKSVTVWGAWLCMSIGVAVLIFMPAPQDPLMQFLSKAAGALPLTGGAMAWIGRIRATDVLKAMAKLDLGKVEQGVQAAEDAGLVSPQADADIKAMLDKLAQGQAIIAKYANMVPSGQAPAGEAGSQASTAAAPAADTANSVGTVPAQTQGA